MELDSNAKTNPCLLGIRKTYRIKWFCHLSFPTISLNHQGAGPRFPCLIFTHLRNLRSWPCSRYSFYNQRTAAFLRQASAFISAMRSLLYSLLSLATIASTFAADIPAENSADKETEDWDEVVPDTIFNGQTVPPMRELTSENHKEEISKGNW